MKNKKAQLRGLLMNKNLFLYIIIALLIFILFFSQSPSITNNTFIQQLREFIESEPSPASVTGDRCFDSDGNDAYVNGYVSIDDEIFAYDECQSEFTLREYICLGDEVSFVFYACPLGWLCFDSRSGDYCYNPTGDGDGGDEGGGGAGGGDDSGTGYNYDECYSIAQEHGKDYFDIGFVDFWGCDSYAWDYCDAMGKSITLLDWYSPNCCIWSCG